MIDYMVDKKLRLHFNIKWLSFMILLVVCNIYMFKILLDFIEISDLPMFFYNNKMMEDMKYDHCF